MYLLTTNAKHTFFTQRIQSLSPVNYYNARQKFINFYINCDARRSSANTFLQAAHCTSKSHDLAPLVDKRQSFLACKLLQACIFYSKDAEQYILALKGLDQFSWPGLWTWNSPCFGVILALIVPA